MTSGTFAEPHHNGGGANTDDEAESDIYRGEPSLSIRSRRSVSSRASSSSSSTSSSSSSSSFLGGRLGAIGAIAQAVDHAITKWAKGKYSSSSSASSSSSSSSSTNSLATVTRSNRARLRKNRSTATLQSIQTEKTFAAHISRLKAREESRQIIRSFSFYVPPAIPQKANKTRQKPPPQWVSGATSLPLVLSQLESALKSATKARRNALRQLDTNGMSERALGKRPQLGPEHQSQPAAQRTRSSPALNGKFKAASPYAYKQQAWFLDVASPTWEDLRAIGKLLRLHPLTLEDILQQDPREKLELFPKLGYYFVSFRAIQSKRASVDDEKVLPVTGVNIQEGSIPESNIYLVVFEEGICTFHFTDMSDHIGRIRDRILRYQDNNLLSSDWIAHGILDSVVDSFFPVLQYIEREVMSIEDLVLMSGDQLESHQPQEVDTVPISPPPSKTMFLTKEKLALLDEKPSHFRMRRIRTRFTSPNVTVPIALRRAKRTVVQKFRQFFGGHNMESGVTTTTLLRMARTRRLVTSLTRLLSTKSEVISQIRKRLTSPNQSVFTKSYNNDEDSNIGIYMGDVQDHILTFQTSLAHYERILSQSHPTYIAQLRTGVSLTKSGTDKAILQLSVVTIGVLCSQTLLSLFSINVTIPANYLHPGGKYNVFGCIIAGIFVIWTTYLSVVRHWWNMAKRRRATLL